MSYAQAEERVQEQFLVLQQAGNVTPANSGIDSLNLILLLGWLLACPVLSDTTFGRSRLPIFISIVASSTWNLFHIRSIGVIGSIGIGLNSVLFIILAVNFVILHDSRTFKRLALRPVGESLQATEHTGVKRNIDTLEKQGSIPLAWEIMPTAPSRRLAWVLDLISSVRAVQWSWKPSPSPLYPQSLRVARSSRTSALSRNLSRFPRDYILIDLVKCLMIKDPYFLGDTSYGAPSHLSAYVESRFALRTYRLLLGMTGTYLAIDLDYATMMLVQVNILGPGILGFNACPSTFLPCWGSPRAVMRNGLRGFWGETWH